MNRKNIQRVVDEIERNPACWDQKTWHCGITHCFFGLAQIMSGKPENSNMTRRDARIFLGMTMDEADYFAAPHRTLSEFRDAVSGQDRFDREGFDREGFDRDGFDRDGFDRDGFRNGFNWNGFNWNGFNWNGFNWKGFDQDGFDRDGFDRNNNPKEIIS